MALDLRNEFERLQIAICISLICDLHACLEHCLWNNAQRTMIAGASSAIPRQSAPLIWLRRDG